MCMCLSVVCVGVSACRVHAPDSMPQCERAQYIENRLTKDSAQSHGNMNYAFFFVQTISVCLCICGVLWWESAHLYFITEKNEHAIDQVCCFSFVWNQWCFTREKKKNESKCVCVGNFSICKSRPRSALHFTEKPKRIKSEEKSRRKIVIELGINSLFMLNGNITHRLAGVSTSTKQHTIRALRFRCRPSCGRQTKMLHKRSENAVKWN